MLNISCTVWTWIVDLKCFISGCEVAKHGYISVYYCSVCEGPFTKIVNHVERHHDKRVLKVRSLEHHIETGKIGFRTHSF